MALFFLLLIAFGFSQTSTFRNFLKDKIVDIVEDGTNGKLTIERLDGTLFTSIFLLNANLYSDKDTLASVKKIEVKISPLHLLISKIYVRKVELEKVNFNLLSYGDGTNNLGYLFSPPKPEEPDTSATVGEDEVSEEDSTGSDSSLKFLVQVGNLSIKDASIRMQQWERRNEYSEYQELNASDLVVTNLNLSAKLAADLSTNDIFFNLIELSAKPNIEDFRLKKLKGKFRITKDYASAEYLRFITDSSYVTIDARMDSFNLFAPIDLEQFRDNPVKVIIDAKNFYMNDLTRFVEATKILKGKPSLYLDVDGKFGDININELDLEYRDTRLDISGNLRNLHTPHLLELDVKIDNSHANYHDVKVLMPGLDLPDFPGARIDRLDLWMKGEPTMFRAGIAAEMDESKLNSEVYLDVKNSKMNYGITFNTENFDVKPFTGVSSNLNLKGQGIGEGVNPEELVAQFSVKARNSQFDFVDIDTLDFRAISDDKRIKINLNGELLSFGTRISGYFDYKNPEPIYNYDGKFTNLDLAKITDDSLYSSNLNFLFSAEGEGLTVDSIKGRYNIQLSNSEFNNKTIEDADVLLELIRDDEGRAINLVSDFLDFNLNGKFSLDTAISLLTYQSQIVSDVIGEKVSVFNPLRTSEAVPVYFLYDSIPPVSQSELEFSFRYKFKDISMFATFLGEEILEISGNGEGELKNNKENFTISNNLYVDYFIRRNGNDIIYFSDVDANLNFSRDNQILAFDNLFGSMAITGERIFAGGDISDVKGDITFNENNLVFDISGEYEDYLKAYVGGILSMSYDKQELEIGEIELDYKGNTWHNEDNPFITFTPEVYTIENMKLVNDTTSLSFDGTLDFNGVQKYVLHLENFSGSTLNSHLDMEPGTLPDGVISIDADINGNVTKPKIALNVNWHDVTYGGIDFGDLNGTMYYDSLKLVNKLKFIGAGENEGKTLLNLDGEIPVNLAFVNAGDRFPTDRDIKLSFVTEEFDLNIFGNTLPFVRNQRGLLTAFVDVSGNYDHLIYNGNLAVKNGVLYARRNNLDYNFEFSCDFDQDRVDVPLIKIANGNIEETDNKGEMIITGGVNTDNLSLQRADINVGGDLTVLSSASRAVSPNMYGEVFIGTDGDWQLVYQNGRPLFKGNILLKDVNLTYQPESGKYSSTGGFNYIFIQDPSKIDSQKIKFQKIAALTDSTDEQRLFDEQSTDFNFEIQVSTINEASVKIPLSNSSSQKLSADVRGSMIYSSIGGLERAQGVFSLLSGSNLEFFKVLEAEGSLKFEGDVKNPYLDIIASYNNEYINPPNYPDQTVETEVRIHIEGTVDELGKNLATNQENIKVYVGSRNIQNDIADESYDASDAISFILFDRFKEDLTPDDKNRVASQPELFESTATSFLGSVLTGFVNSAVGDYINNIQLSQTTKDTKFSVSGRYQRFRYKLGGTTEIFENIEKANLRLAYLFSNSFLVRLERKDPVVQNTGLEEKVNELGLQYRFEF